MVINREDCCYFCQIASLEVAFPSFKSKQGAAQSEVHPQDILGWITRYNFLLLAVASKQACRHFDYSTGYLLPSAVQIPDSN